MLAMQTSLLCFVLLAFACSPSLCATLVRQIHIAVAGDDSDTMAVSWLTDADTPSNYLPTVWYGLRSGHYSYNAAGTSSKYDISYHHDVVLPSLTPNTLYYYAVGDANGGGAMSQEAYFTAPPKAGSPVLTLIVGDMGINNSLETMAAMKQSLSWEQQPDLFLHIGDISYADDRDELGSNPDYEPILNQFFDEVENVTSYKPYHVCPGNHDVTCHSLGDLFCPTQIRNFTAFRYRWRMPWRESGGQQNMWYSFNYGNIHFVSISTETDYEGAPSTPGTIIGPSGGGFGDQISWLQDDLNKANSPENRNIRPWIVIYGHRPMYTSANLDWPLDQQTKTRKAMEEILFAHEVDMYIAGHVHAYERNWPSYHGVKQMESYDHPNCTVHLINGAAGDIEGHSKHLATPPPDFTAFRDSDHYGYSTLQAFNSSTLCWTFYASSTMSQIDQICVNK